MKLTRSKLKQALRDSGGNVASAALALGVSRQAVYHAVGRFRIRRRRESKAVISEKARRSAYARWRRESAA